MTAIVCDSPNGHPDMTVDAVPKCGDYCDSCGDCLHCYGEYDCGGIEGRSHMWVVYADIEPERAAELLAASGVPSSVVLAVDPSRSTPDVASAVAVTARSPEREDGT
jgi:hypothetical protein